MEEVEKDCNRAIKLDEKARHAYFLRGLARFELGQVEKACMDFQKAIDLGFTILEDTEKEKCSAFWEP
jgi:hypothetical protein